LEELDETADRSVRPQLPSAQGPPNRWAIHHLPGRSGPIAPLRPCQEANVMFPLTHRWSMVTVATLCFAGFPGPVAHAQHVRHDARSPEGQKMLKIYAKAVAKMMATKPGDPDSWEFQWYTHSVKGSTNKAAAIVSIYGPMPSPLKSLAQDMWETCQAHHAGDD